MAYGKLYKWFSQFRKLPFTDWVYWYKEYVLKTPEQREFERIESRNRARTGLAKLGVISSVVHNMSEYGRW